MSFSPKIKKIIGEIVKNIEKGLQFAEIFCIIFFMKSATNKMEIKVAKTAGFCYGVKRAVDKVYEVLEQGGKIATLGALIHNRQVIEDLARKGVYAYNSPEEIPEDCTIVIRAHGVGKDVYERIGDRPYIDLTCPFVEKIHRIVREHYEKGYKIVIVGDKNHPEVKGINGWCDNSALVIYGKDAGIDAETAQKAVCIVAQTTINKEIFGEIVKNAKKTCNSPLVFDTICSATKDRQTEAAELAKESDCMIVIGGKESSNTRKLFEISSAACKETYHIETCEEIPRKGYKKLGITAGASTPSRIIEEVVKAMSEVVKNEESFEELLKQQEDSMILKNGQIVEGTVMEVRSNEVIVDLGIKYDGQLAADQLTDDPSLKPSDVVKVGDTIKVYVVGVNDGEGKVVLSSKKLVAMESWNKIKAAYEAGECISGKIIKAVKGGVIALADGSQVFIPARQASERFIQDLSTLVGTTAEFKIIEIEERRKRVIGSIREVLAAARKEREDKFWAEAEVGKKYQGTVKSLTSFGAFVDIGGVDGLVHISELSWNKIKHPSEVVAVGDVLEVYIKDMNAETKKISLGFKKFEDNPWEIAKNQLNVGDVIEVTIVRMMSFGAFAEILPGVDGLIHISQIADKRIGKPEEVLTIGQKVNVKVTDLKWDEKKISLSIRALIQAPAEKAEEEEEEEPTEGEVLVYSTEANEDAE